MQQLQCLNLCVSADNYSLYHLTEMMELFKNGSTKTRNCVVKASQDITGLQMNLGDVLPPSMDLFSPE